MRALNLRSDVSFASVESCIRSLPLAFCIECRVTRCQIIVFLYSTEFSHSLGGDRVKVSVILTIALVRPGRYRSRY